MASRTSILLGLLSAAGVGAQSFGATPVMGWTSYNQVACSPDEGLIRNTINALADRGFPQAGYQYFGIDCGWADRNGRRNSTTGSTAIDLQRFPNGLQPLADLVRSRGMRWSMYSDAGYRMCDTTVPSPVLGSRDVERQDAEFFASLGTEYLKYDYCYVDGPNADQNAPKDPRTDFIDRYSVMWNELQRVGIHGMLICQWGTPYASSSGLQGPAQWTDPYSTSFRLSDDIAQGWSHMYRIYNQNVHIARSGLIGPGHFADADMLEVGNPGMSLEEQGTHFAAWAMFKSALIISTDVPNMSSSVQAILQNRDLIAVNQDPLGRPVRLVQRWTGDRDVWVGDLSNGELAVLVVNLGTSSRTLNLDLASIGVRSATVRDLWTGAVRNGATSASRAVGSHGNMALRLSNVQRTNAAAPSYNYVAASTGSLANGANIQPCSGCASPNKVGYIGGGSNGRLALSNIRTSHATQAVRFDFINGDIGYLAGNAPNERLASVSVNGGPAVTVSFPLSGYNWDRDVHAGYLVELSGFNTNGPNTVVISGSGAGNGPDLDRIGFVA